MERISKREYYLDIASSVSQRSSCLKRQYGCVIVNNNEIIATGYNGSPRGFLNCTDNGVCKRMNVPHNSGDYSDCTSVHAEQNAMISASRKDMIGSVMYLACNEIEFNKDGKIIRKEIYDIKPCPICARMIINAGIRNVITRNYIYDKHDLNY